MSRALVIGASGGIGNALIAELQGRGYETVGLSRSVDGLDITNEDSVKSAIASLQGYFDTVVVATGALSSGARGPEKTLKDLNMEEMAAQFAINAIAPMLVLKNVVRLLPRDRPAVFCALSARVGSIAENNLGGWYSYRASKAALNQFIKTASIEMKRTHKLSACIALHPGTVVSEFTKNYRNHPMVFPQVAANNILNIIANVTAEETGTFFDWRGDTVSW